MNHDPYLRRLFHSDDPSFPHDLLLGREFKRFIRNLSIVLLSGPWNKQALFVRQTEAFGVERAWMRHVAELAYGAYPGFRPPRLKLLQLMLLHDWKLYTLPEKPLLKSLKPLFTPSPAIEPPEQKISTPFLVRLYPRAATDGDLCRLFDISTERLDWFANVHTREHGRTCETLRHYSYKWIRKRSGGWRLLEIPKSKLKEIQRIIYFEALWTLCPHKSAYGFSPGLRAMGIGIRLPAPIASFVRMHADKPMVLRMDLKDFFTSVEASRVHAIFRMAGYSEHIARRLTALCTNTVPADKMSPSDPRACATALQEIQLRTPHLPQGAPTSPALANLSAYHLDARLSGLAKRFGWSYTRYADDLLFSGPVLGKKLLAQFQVWVEAIARAEHFRINPLKTRVMRRSVCQYAAGLVFNNKPNISRKKYDDLKAILHNCAKHGPTSQNRYAHPDFRAHLAGRISFAAEINPEKGKKLKALFGRINWGSGADTPVCLA